MSRLPKDGERLIRREYRCLADLFPDTGWQSRAVDAGDTIVEVFLGEGHLTITVYTLGGVGTCYTAVLLPDDARALAVKLAKGADHVAPMRRSGGGAP